MTDKNVTKESGMKTKAVIRAATRWTFPNTPERVEEEKQIRQRARARSKKVAAILAAHKRQPDIAALARQFHIKPNSILSIVQSS
ncbi:MAG: hypothetical protein WA254_03895 [Candidatus Sulfotelmatobacter sp.]